MLRTVNFNLFILLVFFNTAIATQKSLKQFLNDSKSISGKSIINQIEFGRSVANLGDLDGDGVNDITVGAPEENGHGVILILFLNTDGTVKSYQKIKPGQSGFNGILDIDDRFGISIANLGDLNNDGIIDIAVGAECDDDGGDMRGAIWILFMNTDGTVKAHQKISATEGGFNGNLIDGAEFGFAVENIGDLDNDGIIDIAVGAVGDDDGSFMRFVGSVWILFLNSDGTVKLHQKISNTQGGFQGDLFPFNAFGSSITNLGDLDEDGINDIAVGAEGDCEGSTHGLIGAVWILHLNSDGTVRSNQKINTIHGGFTGKLQDLGLFGSSVCNLGDLDKDGIIDIAVGAKWDDGSGDNRGAVWIIYLNKNGTVKTCSKISETEGAFTGNLNDNAEFGASICNLDDFNSDGIVDIAVGSPGVEGSGAIWFLYMNSDGSVKSNEDIITAIANKNLDDSKSMNYYLANNYPNPFNSSTVIQFNLPSDEYVTLKILNSRGQEIATLIDNPLKSGTYNISWEAKDHSSGIYIYNIRTETFCQSKKMILIK